MRSELKTHETGENYMVEEHIKSQNERIERLQDEMINVQNKLAMKRTKI